MTTNLQAHKLLGGSLAGWRQAREMIDAADLLKLARDAVRLEMAAKSFDAEQRADAAAEIVARVLADLSDAPRHTDPPCRPLRRGLLAPHERRQRPAETVAISSADRRASRAALRGHAANIRTKILADRKRHAEESALAPMSAPEQLAPDAQAWSLVARTARAVAIADRLEIDAERRHVMAALMAWTDPRPERSRPPMDGAERQRIARGRREILRQHPDGRDIARKVTGGRERPDGYFTWTAPGSVPTAGVSGPGSRPWPAPRRADDVGHDHGRWAQDWRTAPETPAPVKTRRARVRKTRDERQTDRDGRTRIGRVAPRTAPMTEAETAAALARLARAQARAIAPTDQRERRRQSGAEPTI